MRRGTPRFRLRACEAAVGEWQARIPLRPGEGRIRVVPVLLARAKIESSAGKLVSGLAAQCLLPEPFEFSSAEAYRKYARGAILAFRIARETFLEAGTNTAAATELWESAHPRILEKGALAGLASEVCVGASSLVERAIVDALSRLKGLSFSELLRQDWLGIRTSKALPSAPVSEFSCRHRIGLLDPLTVNEIPAGLRAEDALPQALEEHIEFHGFRNFSAELSGEGERDLERLSRLAVLLEQRCRGGYQVALDAKERYEDPSPLERTLQALRDRPYGAEFLRSLRFLRRPLPRGKDLEPEAAESIARLSKFAPLVIEGRGDRVDFVESALKLGYKGFAIATERGLFRSLRISGASALIRANREGSGTFKIGGDFATPPVIGLNQELAALSALGISECGPGAYQFFHGLDGLPRAEAENALSAHSDLYEQRGKSVFLRLEEGRIIAGSIQAPGFGYSIDVAFESRTPLDSWSPARIEPEEDGVVAR